MVAVPLEAGDDKFEPCDVEAVSFIRVPYLMGKSVFVPVCRTHRAQHNDFFAAQRSSKKVGR